MISKNKKETNKQKQKQHHSDDLLKQNELELTNIDFAMQLKCISQFSIVLGSLIISGTKPTNFHGFFF